MPSFADSIFLFVLALLLFGPKRLPVLARELGKWVGEFRRASNEFKFQMEEELRAVEQADRQKQIAAMEAAAPLPPPLEPESEHPHLRANNIEAQSADTSNAQLDSVSHSEHSILAPERAAASSASSLPEESDPSLAKADGVRPVPIATAGDLQMMPPATGLPTPRPRHLAAAEPATEADPLAGVLGSIPEVIPDHTPEPTAHGD